MEELRKQIKSEKFSLEKIKKEYKELKQKTDEDIASLSDVESSYDPNKSGNREMWHATLKKNIQRNKEMIENRIQSVSGHIDKLQEKEKDLEERKAVEVKEEKLNNDLLELEKKVKTAKLLIKSITPNMKLEEFHEIEKEINDTYDLLKKQLDELSETSQEILGVIGYDFTIINRVGLSLFSLKSDIKSSHENLIVVAESKKKELDNDLLELQKEIDELKNQINSANSEITLNRIKDIEEKHLMLQNKWDKLDDKAEEVNEAIDYNSTLIAQLGCDITGLEHDIKSLWKTLAKTSISKKFKKEYEDKLSDKKEKTVYFDKKLGEKVYDFDKITKHAVTGSDTWNKASNLASNLFTSCNSLFFKNKNSSNDDGIV
ncbi:MAG: hypothetical protein GY820_04595 [Gammaproteobacteria bacterium]|nr:hypothetical protein [Gammaproteobacteria bacterium]